ncbi:MAG: histidinol-phosphatase HisJ family protein [Spirochaetes bacterium]|nr:MAG: histidinol-phosphatase HisJ family protein [Spirochaetota bacterium]
MVDYHTHTELCEHAVGSVDDYIRAAIDGGLQEIGFADHAPLPDNLREGITMRVGDTEKYLSLIAGKRAEYAGRIAVKTGFEVDFPFFDTFDRRYLTHPGIDYLIGSCHFIGDWPFDHPAATERFKERDIDEIYTEYYAILERLIASGAFQIIGHFDLVKKFGHRARAEFEDTITVLARACASRDIAVELNTAGLRKPVGEIYPSQKILGILFRENTPVTLGSDAHAPEEVAWEFARAVELLRRTGYRSISGFSARRRYDIPL